MYVQPNNPTGWTNRTCPIQSTGRIDSWKHSVNREPNSWIYYANEDSSLVINQSQIK